MRYPMREEIERKRMPLVGHRKFHDLPRTGPSLKVEDPESLAEYVGESVLEGDFVSPLRGRLRRIYCDYVASGKPLSFIEDFIREEVLPTYANTHTTSTVSSLQTTLFRHEARDAFRNSVGASESDAVIFVGSGTTGALHKLIHALGISGQSLTLLVGKREHHSNLLPWREISADIRYVGEKDCGCLDHQDLVKCLEEERSIRGVERLIIGAFSAASNVTGRMNDDLTVTAILHSFGALSFWDYATAAPYVNIDMNPKVPEDQDNLCYKDAVYFSVHKFVGGTQTPGVLIAKKSLFRNKTPYCGGGGGSVFFVTENDHVYLKDPEVREEGGTPPIVESIRAGLVIQLKESVGSEYIIRKEKHIFEKVYSKLSKVPQLILLGDNSDKLCGYSTLPIFSFLIKTPLSTYLHHNYVTTLLNDLFGIQSRGGCACAGPYSQQLLGISFELAKEFEQLLLEDSRLDRTHLRRGQREYSSFEILRPGFTRLNFSWFFDNNTIDRVVDAIKFVAEEGWKFLPQYIFNNETGEWKHHSNLVFKERKWLGNISYTSGRFEYRPGKTELSSERDNDIKEVNLDSLLQNTEKAASRLQVPDQRVVFESVSRFRWFTLPIEAKEVLRGKTCSSVEPIFRPNIFKACCQDECLSGSLCTTVSEKYSFRKDLQFNRGSFKIWPQTLKSLEVKPPTDPDQINNIKKVSSSKDLVCFLPRKDDDSSAASVGSFKVKWHSPPSKEIFKPFLEAVEQFSMINNGDRVLVCLSGGKDSLSLLHTVRQYRFYAEKTHGIKFELGALTVDPGSSAYDPRPLIPYLKQLGVHYLYERQDIMSQALKADCSSICSYCSRMKRGRIYAAARRENYNVLALGQHLDDLTESFLMSVFHNGRLRTMKANYFVRERDLRVIRPFVYVREKNLREFAESCKLPIISENCPACFESPKERHRTKQLLAAQELIFPKLYWSLKSAMLPLIKINATGIEKELFGALKDEDDEEDV